MATNSNPFDLAMQEIESNPFDDAEKELQHEEQATDSLWKQSYDMIFSPEESPFEQGLGQSIRGIGTAVAGIPGDIYQSVKGLAEVLPKPPEWMQKLDAKPSFLQEKGKNILEKIPGSHELKESFDIATEGKYKPQSKSEEFLQEAGGDIVTSLMPNGRYIRPIAAAIGGNLVKQGAKELGFEPDKAEYGKMASMMFLSTFNPRGARQYTANLYDSARQTLPPGATINAQNMIRDINDLNARLSRGLKHIPTKAPVFTALKDLKKNVGKNGHIPIENLMQAKININELRDHMIFSPEIKGKTPRAALRRNFADVSNIVDEALNQYGQTNPEFLNFYRRANTAWGGIEQSQRASQFIARHAKKIAVGSTVGSLITGITSPSTLIPIAGSIVGGGAALKSYELLHRIVRNPELARYYSGILTEAARENAPAMLRNIIKLDKNLEKENQAQGGESP